MTSSGDVKSLRPGARLQQFASGPARHQADVVVRAGAHTVQAERAIKVAADLRREERGAATRRATRPVANLDLAATGDVVKPDHGRRGVTAVDALMADAVTADLRVLHRDLRRRAGGMDEVEAAQRANVLAEGRFAKGRLQQEGGEEVGDDEPGRQPGAGPKVQPFVKQKEREEAGDGQPLVAQNAREIAAAAEAFAQCTRQGERAGHAEQVAGQQKYQHDQTAVMHPGRDRGQVSRGGLRAGQAVDDQQDCRQQQRSLQHQTTSSPAQKASNIRPLQDVRRVGGTIQVAHCRWPFMASGGVSRPLPLILIRLRRSVPARRQRAFRRPRRHD